MNSLRRWLNGHHVGVLLTLILLLLVMDISVALEADVVLAIFVLALVLFVPGTVISYLLFPRGRIDGALRMAMAIGLSLATAILGGLLLDLTPWGITRFGWLILLGGTTALGLVILVLTQTLPVTLSPSRPRPGALPNLRQSILLGSAAIVVVAAFLVAWGATDSHTEPTLTQLWLVPSVAHSETAELGVRNVEPRAVHYDLTVVQDGNVFASWTDIALEPGEQWERQLMLGGAVQRNRAIEVNLYKDGVTEQPYRTVTWWP